MAAVVLILTLIGCASEDDGRPRFCVREVGEECDVAPWGESDPLLLQGCPSGERSGACLMDEPLFSICPETPGGCVPVEDWLQADGWFDAPEEAFLVDECQSRRRGRWFTVLWFPEDGPPLPPFSTAWITWTLWFEGATGSLIGAKYEQLGHASSGWCCGTHRTNTQVWGEYVDPDEEGDCHRIHPGWPGW